MGVPREQRDGERVLHLVAEEREVREPRVRGGRAEALHEEDAVPAHQGCERHVERAELSESDDIQTDNVARGRKLRTRLCPV